MKIENNIIKHYLKNVYFITGTAYAGKSTMVSMLAKEFNLIKCGENYHSTVSDEIAQPDIQPSLSYFKTMKDWQEFISRTPKEYENSGFYVIYRNDLYVDVREELFSKLVNHFGFSK